MIKDGLQRLMTKEELQRLIKSNDNGIKHLNKKRAEIDRQIVDAYSAIKIYTQRLKDLENSII
jgi:peptidoglycan hydrolase CwlO-like protein